MNPIITKEGDEDGIGYFIVRWSLLEKVDKYQIQKKVPAMAGLFELYYMDDKEKLVRFYISRVWIGGLRSTIRWLTDPSMHDSKKWVDTLENKTCYFRYSLSESFNDLTDVFFFFAESIDPNGHKTYHSNRYEEIRVEEISPQKIVTI